MSDLTDKQLHLTFVQDAVKRMAQNSFAIKGWCVGVVSVVLAYSVKDGLPSSLRAALFPLVSLWLLDAYFVSIERRFRLLYEEVRVRPGAESDYSMTPRLSGSTFLYYLRAAFSGTVLPFYVALALVLEAISIGQGQPTSLTLLHRFISGLIK